MVKELVVYPDERIKITSADVRAFDQKLFDVIENMKDTMRANELHALSAIQIAIPATIVLIEEDNGDILELINPRIIGSEGQQESLEETAYLPNLSALVKRYDKIKLIYQDRSGAQKSMDIDGERSIIIQRKIDLTFGGTYIDKLDKKGRKEIEKKLDYGLVSGTGGSCPTKFKREYLTTGINYLLYLGFILLFAKFFLEETQAVNMLYSVEAYISLTILVTTVVYFFYAQYEGKLYTTCTSCQIGNIIGITVIILFKLLILFLLSYFWIKP